MSYEKYKKKIQKDNIIIKITQILLLVLFLILWQTLSYKNIINSFITSSPYNILRTIYNLIVEKNLWIHIFTTIKECIISFCITTFLSLLIATLLYNFNIVYKILDPYLTVLNSIPKVSFGPLIIIWIGANTKSIITIAVLISIIISIENIYIGFKNTDKIKIKLLKTFNASKKDIFIHLVLKENINTIISALKINISMCLVGVITGEFLTSKCGIGYLILYGSQVFNLNLVMTGIFLLTIISYIMYKILNIKK